MARGGIAKLFSQHYAMERFCVVTVFVILAIIATVVWIGVGMYHDGEEAYADTTVFEKMTNGTQSGASVELTNLTVDRARTRCVMQLKFADPGKVPADVDSYVVHVTGANRGRTANRDYNRGIGGSFYLYGTSGDALIYMTCPGGFDDGVYRVSLEATATVSSEGTQSDVFQFDIHPGSRAAQVSDALAGDSFDAAEYYAGDMLAKDEDADKAALDADVEALGESLSALNEYATRLKGEGLVVDGMIPKYMDGDVVKQDSQGRPFLSSKTDVPGALNIDWRDTRALDGGYSKQVDLGGMTLSEFIAEYKGATYGLQREETKVTGTWKFSDGRVFEDVHSKNASERYDAIAEDITRYESTVSTYLTLKSAFQTRHQLSLLELEEQARTMSDTVKVKVDCVEPY